MSDILLKLSEFHQQATVERSHYYVSRVLTEAADEVKRLREANAEMLAALKALLRCPDIDDIDPEDRDPETEDAIRVARALITSIARAQSKQAEGGE